MAIRPVPVLYSDIPRATPLSNTEDVFIIQYIGGQGLFRITSVANLHAPALQTAQQAVTLANEAITTANGAATNALLALNTASFDLGVNNVTTLVNLPITKHMIIATVTVPTTMSFASTPNVANQRVEYTILVKNNSAGLINQPIPTTNGWSTQNPSTVPVPAGGYALIGVARINNIWFAALIYM